MSQTTRKQPNLIPIKETKVGDIFVLTPIKKRINAYGETRGIEGVEKPSMSDLTIQHMAKAHFLCLTNANLETTKTLRLICSGLKALPIVVNDFSILKKIDRILDIRKLATSKFQWEAIIPTIPQAFECDYYTSRTASAFHFPSGRSVENLVGKLRSRIRRISEEDKGIGYLKVYLSRDNGCSCPFCGEYLKNNTKDVISISVIDHRKIVEYKKAYMLIPYALDCSQCSRLSLIYVRQNFSFSLMHLGYTKNFLKKRELEKRELINVKNAPKKTMVDFAAPLASFPTPTINANSFPITTTTFTTNTGGTFITINPDTYATTQ
ncbi:MAG TPA: hypothetical protein ENI23_00150 [bacterium]|nr:hypothetical protein [bacterium]